MMRILRSAGIPPEVLKLVAPVVETCAVCRQWQQPGRAAISTATSPTTHNQCVELDLAFIKHQRIMQTVMVVTDRCTRWVATGLCASKETGELLSTFDRIWTSIFGPPGELYIDGETGLDNAETEEWM
eukprot:1569629-Amphidinium_carterae.1